MKRLLFSLVLEVFIVSVVFAQEQNTNSKGVFIEGQGRKFAVLIGINDYENMRKLRYAKNDVTAIRDQLYKIGFEKENVFYLVCGGTTAELPTKDRILTTIRHAVDLAKEGDILVIVMTGHGIEANDGQSRFCSVETQPDNLLTTTVPINEIFEAVERSKATFKLMMIDACRDDPFRGRAAFGAKTIDTLDNPPKGALLLQSCAKGEMSLEDDEFKQGIFSYYVAEGLSGKAADKEGRVTLLGLSEYVIDKTRRRAYELETRRQVPYLKGEITNFVLANAPGANTRTLTTLPLPTPAEVLPIPNGRRVNVSTAKQLYAAFDRANAKDGDVIVLAPGTYDMDEDISVSHKGNVVLYGDPQNPQNVKIRIAQDTIGRISFSGDGYTKLIGLDISGTVLLYSAKVDVLFCNIHDSKSQGIDGLKNATILVENSIITNNDSGGLNMYQGSLTMNNCLVSKNNANGIESAGFENEVNITLIGCEISENKFAGFRMYSKGRVATVTGCTIRNNGHNGVEIGAEASGEFRNNTLDNNSGNWRINLDAGKVVRTDNTPNK